MIEKAKKLCSLGAMHRNKKTIEAASLRFISPRCAVLLRIKYKYHFEYKPHCQSQHLYEHQQTHQHQDKHQMFMCCNQSTDLV